MDGESCAGFVVYFLVDFWALIANIFERTIDNSIKTNTRWKDIYGVSPAIIGEI